MSLQDLEQMCSQEGQVVRFRKEDGTFEDVLYGGLSQEQQNKHAAEQLRRRFCNGGSKRRSDDKPAPITASGSGWVRHG